LRKFDAAGANFARAGPTNVACHEAVVALATIPSGFYHRTAQWLHVTQLLVSIPALLRLQNRQSDPPVNRLHPHKDTFFSES
jgi:hypothetical protein